MDSVILKSMVSCAIWVDRVWQESVIALFLARISHTLRVWAASSQLLSFFFGSWHENTAWQESHFRHILAGLFSPFYRLGTTGRRILPWLKESNLIRFAWELPERTAAAPVRFVALGAIGAIPGYAVIQIFLGSSFSPPVWIGLLASFGLAFGLRSQNSDLGALLEQSWLVGTFCRAFGINLNRPHSAASPHSQAFPVLTGLVLGIASGFPGGYWAAAAAAGLLGAMIILRFPWAGIPLIGLTLPLVPTMLVWAMIVFTAAAWLLDGFRNGKLNFRPDPAFFPIVLFFVAATVAFALSLSRALSLMYWLLYVGYFLLYLLAGQLLKTENQHRLTVAMLLFSGIAVAALGLWQYSGGAQTAQAWVDAENSGAVTVRVFSTLDNPNVLASYLVMLIPLCAALFFTGRRLVSRFWPALIGLVLTACLIVTFSRGGWLALLIAAVLFAVIWERRLLILLIVLLLIFPFVAPDTIMNRILTTGSLEDSSNFYRIGIWTGALHMLKDFWPTGIGLGSPVFKIVYSYYRVSGAVAQHAHNLYLELFIEMGIIGFMGLLYALWSIIRYHLRSLWRFGSQGANLFSVAVFSGMAGHLTHQLVDNTWYGPKMALLFWMLIGLSFSFQALAAKKSGRGRP
ncbi:MAG: O-antigen ligase family protein [Solirubrobacterales bacterium]